MVGQFVGIGPPVKVVRSTANWLWGYEGPVEVSLISAGFFLFEFASEELRDWVLKRSWHVHKATMVIRKWHSWIRSIDFANELRPVWIEFSGVPPELLYPNGVSWLASQLGKPINGFVRQGFTVKVCVLREDTSLERKELVIAIRGVEPAVVQVGFPVFRGPDASRGNARSHQIFVAARGKSSGNVPESSAEEKGAPEEASGMPTGGGGG
ncbi:hypothetical protein LINPERPRIM_LOCUS7211 [Linum perenne]